MLGVGHMSFLISLLPQVEDPWPDSIGLELRGLGGFGLGALFYILALLNQVVFD